jgi:hypothetical protein
MASSSGRDLSISFILKFRTNWLNLSGNHFKIKSVASSFPRVKPNLSRFTHTQSSWAHGDLQGLP